MDFKTKKMSLHQQNKERYEALKKEMKELEPAKDRYFELSFEAGKLSKQITQYEKESRLNRLEYETKFKNCEFHGMGSVAENGEATFENEEQAVNLCMALSEGNYHKAYHVKDWKGPGRYDCVPQWKYDHDRDVIYSGVFVKAEDQD